MSSLYILGWKKLNITLDWPKIWQFILTETVGWSEKLKSSINWFFNDINQVFVKHIVLELAKSIHPVAKSSTNQNVLNLINGSQSFKIRVFFFFLITLDNLKDFQLGRILYSKTCYRTCGTIFLKKIIKEGGCFCILTSV